MHILVEIVGWIFIAIFESIVVGLMRLFGWKSESQVSDSKKILIGLLVFVVIVLVFLWVYKLFFATGVG